MTLLIHQEENGVMASSILNARTLQSEAAAYAWVEERLWPNGPVCPHCGGVERISKMNGKSTRIGVYKCYQCRKQFTVKVGTVFEDSHVPMRIWLQAIYLLCSSKKGISSNQLARTLGVTLKTAWFLSHRIREAMRVVGMEPMGSGGGIIEADETFIGRREGARPNKAGFGHKMVVMTLVERGGKARSFQIEHAGREAARKIINENVSQEARLMTDSAGYYRNANFNVASHEKVSHQDDEWVRGDAHTNTVEGYYSVFKRGMKGVYQHCSEKHLHRYAAEFDFRYSNRVRLGVDDAQRTELALKGVVGKRLTYRTPHH
jgi:transposase-like protein